MENLFTVILIILIIILIILNKTNANKANDSIKEMHFPYKRKYLLSKAEYAFYQILKQECDAHSFLICPKVRMEDYLDITDKQNYMKYRGYIKSRHIDFLLCDEKLNIIAGIELDDNSHSKKDTQKVDEFKNGVFQAINIPLYRVKMSEGQYKDTIIKIISELTNKLKNAPNTTIIVE